ncbi:putative efflux pump antibiotic resistance protein [Hypoxylon argillaceum]|nr:putative efflux pump antibiotic resistance protein [Hypoxylon argillaceum]
MNESTPLLQNQSHILPQKRLLLIFPVLALIQFTSFLDQTAIATSLPTIASALEFGSSISVVGTAFLITSTSIQLINGRLSDIFGRKTSLTAALIIMCIGNILCGFSTTPLELFTARAFTGFGAGAINALVQIAMADITTLEQRGYYFGLVGVAVSLGSGLGPVVGGMLTQTVGWRWAFWFVCPICLAAIGYFLSVWPSSQPRSTSSGTWNKLKLLDWIGACSSLVSITLILIPVSQGGLTLSWSSPITLSMLCAGVLLFGFFIIYEWRVASLPILPFQLFYYGFPTNILLSVNFVIGWIFWSNLLVLPLYLQNVRGMSPAKAGVMMLPMVITHGITSGITGVIISVIGHYKPIIVTGAVSWGLAAIGKLRFDLDTPLWMIAGIGVLDGVAVGCSLQPVLVGLFAGSASEDRAVLTGLRNFIRDMGGATGTAVSGAILTNLVSAQLSSSFSREFIAKLCSSAFALSDLGLTEEEKNMISRGYMDGLHGVFTSFAVLIALNICCCICIVDYGLKKQDFPRLQGRLSQEQA